MKNITLIISAAFIVAFSAAKLIPPAAESGAVSLSSSGCAPSFNGEITPDESGKFITVIPGWGNYAYRISTSSDSAQFYFNQGLNLYYSYHPKQSLASFKEAARFDENAVMAYWGQALASGPFYNEPVYKMNRSVPANVERMKSASSTATAKEKDLALAMQERYSNDTTNADRKILDKKYADAMFSLTAKYPDDNDIRALYIDAVMLQHKWDFWNNDGTAKSWTPQVVALCANILKSNSSHPAAMHYYIHLTEASRNSSLALESAKLLKDALPGTSHMVHMASHMYQRNGMFAEGVSVNEKANNVSNSADLISPANGSGQNTNMHYYAVQSYCALSAGMYEKAGAVYQRARKRAVELNGNLKNLTYQQFIYMMPTMAAVRSGKWQEISDAPRVDSNWKYASILEDFAVGMASVRLKDYAAAEKSLARMEKNISDSLLQIRRVPFNKPVQGGNIAIQLLHAELSAARGEKAGAEKHYQLAIAEEDKLIYSEPKDWLLPVRQFYGKYLLSINEPNRAEKIYQEDLVAHPGNGWSETGLLRCYEKRRQTAAAAKMKKLVLQAFAQADEIPSASAY